MQWSDEGIVLGARREAESGVVLELMTRDHGRHLGWVHGGRSKRLQSVLQAGNGVHAVWRARLDEHLGSFAVEPSTSRTARLIASPLALYGVAALAALLRLVPERDPHPILHEQAGLLLDHLDDGVVAPALFVRFELSLLAELGFGLDLSSCAASGATRDLRYVSPKSGRAVAAGPGEAYKDRLLALPVFLGGGAAIGDPARDDLEAGFTLTGHFLRLHLFDPRAVPVPEERARFIALALGRR